MEHRHLPNINKITTVIWMRLHWIQQETSHWKLLSQALCRLRQTWLLHYIYYIMLHHYAWVIFRRFYLQCFNYVFANDSQDLRDQQKSPSLQKLSYWSNTYLCTAPWTNPFVYVTVQINQGNNPFGITKYPFVILLFWVMCDSTQHGIDQCH